MLWTSLVLLILCINVQLKLPTVYALSKTETDQLLNNLRLTGSVMYDVAQALETAFPGAKRSWAVFGSIGLILKDVVEYNQPDPVLEQLDELSVTFSAEITFKATLLAELMVDMLKYRTKNIRNEFLDKCKEKSPMQLIVEIKTRLLKPSSNPIIAAVDGNPMKTKTTFSSWLKIVKGLLHQLTALQHFYISQTAQSEADRQIEEDRLENRLEDIESILNDFIRNYEAPYWPSSVNKTIADAQADHKHLDNIAKADYIRDQLYRIHTRDEFYVIVYNDVSGWENHAHQNLENYAMHLFRSEGCNIIVARNRKRYDANSIYGIKNKVEHYGSSVIKIVPNPGLEDIIGKIFKDIENIGFVAVIGDHNVAIRSTGSGERGPGWWTEGKCGHMVIRVSRHSRNYYEWRKCYVIAAHL